MQIIRDLLPWLNLASFLSTVLAAPSPTPTPTEPASTTKSVPDCAASPTEFIGLPFQFWIETIFLKPYIGAPDIEFSPSNPLTIYWDYPISESNPLLKYSKAAVSTQLNTQFFTLSFYDLRNADGGFGVIWPVPSDEFPGYSPLVWDATSDGLNTSLIYLDFTAVKKCTSTNETELLLRAKRSADPRCTYFLVLNLACICGKIKGS